MRSCEATCVGVLKAMKRFVGVVCVGDVELQVNLFVLDAAVMFELKCESHEAAKVVLCVAWTAKICGEELKHIP